MTTIDQESAVKLYSVLDRETIEALSFEIAKLEQNPPTSEEREAVLKEFYNLTMAQKFYEQGGVDYARSLLEKVLPPEETRKIIEIIEASMKQAPFGFLRKADPENLSAILQEEHPQTIAVVLAHLPEQQAAAVMQKLPLQTQVEVVRRIALMERTNPEIIQQVEKSILSRFASISFEESKKIGGYKAAANVLNHIGRTSEKMIYEWLEKENAEMASQIKKLMFTFDDIVKVNDRGLAEVLMTIKNSGTIALALKNVKDEVKEKILKNVAKERRKDIEEQITYLGPVKMPDIERSQQEIIDVILQMEEQGRVIIEGRAGAEEIIV